MSYEWTVDLSVPSVSLFLPEYLLAIFENNNSELLFINASLKLFLNNNIINDNDNDNNNNI